MTWDDVIERLRIADMAPVEEIYMEHYGKILAIDRPEFHGRYFRCTFGQVRCHDVHVEVFLFPSEYHLQEFLEVIGHSAQYLSTGNVVLHFPHADGPLIQNILDAVSATPR
jgi:hypothetical protein